MFDIVYAYFVLHLFNKADCKEIIEEIYKVLKPGGSAVISVAGVNDVDFGKGQEIEENTFTNKRGVTKHYFDESEVRILLSLDTQNAKF